MVRNEYGGHVPPAFQMHTFQDAFTKLVTRSLYDQLQKVYILTQNKLPKLRPSLLLLSFLQAQSNMGY